VRVSPRAVVVAALTFGVAVVPLWMSHPMATAAPGECVTEAQGNELGEALELVGECDTPAPPASSPDPDPEPAPTGSQPAEAPRFAFEPYWGTHPETGEDCIELIRHDSEFIVDSPAAQDWEIRTLQMLGDPRLATVEHRFCDPAYERGDASPAAVAQAFIRSIGIPSPEPHIAPGWALTGMPAYLEIAGQDSFAHEEHIDGFGLLRVEFAPTSFTVRWGDGAETHVEDGRTGVPYDGPESEQISHTYRDASPDNVVEVDAHWQARWRLGGIGGAVGGLQTSEEYPLEVREMQTVRTSGR
jgi:hypothetical protein